MRLSLLFSVSVASLLSLFAVSVPAEEEILVGRSAAGQLKVRIEFDVLTLPPSPFPGISGYATGEVGFHSTILDDPDEDFFQLSTAADFRLVLLAKDPGMEIWNDHGSGFMVIGDTFYVGQPIFDTHPVWNITSGSYNNLYHITFLLRDLNGIYPESEPFQLAFTPVKPATLTIQAAEPGFITIKGQASAALDYITEIASSPSGPWTPVSTNTTDATGSWSFTQSMLPQPTFYRAFVR